MKLFIVTQWGDNNDADGPNAKHNTAALVRAADRDEAVRCAEELFGSLPHSRVLPKAGHVIEIGIDRGTCERSAILLGPVLVRQGIEFGGYTTSWVRHYGPEEWTEVAIADAREE